MTRVLLTGGSGFIATHILELLLKRGLVESIPNLTQTNSRCRKGTSVEYIIGYIRQLIYFSGIDIPL